MSHKDIDEMISVLGANNPDARRFASWRSGPSVNPHPNWPERPPNRPDLEKVKNREFEELEKVKNRERELEKVKNREFEELEKVKKLELEKVKNREREFEELEKVKKLELEKVKNRPEQRQPNRRNDRSFDFSITNPKRVRLGFYPGKDGLPWRMIPVVLPKSLKECVLYFQGIDRVNKPGARNVVEYFAKSFSSHGTSGSIVSWSPSMKPPLAADISFVEVTGGYISNNLLERKPRESVIGVSDDVDDVDDIEVLENEMAEILGISSYHTLNRRRRPSYTPSPRRPSWETPGLILDTLVSPKAETIASPLEVTVTRRNRPGSDRPSSVSKITVSGGERWIPFGSKTAHSYEKPDLVTVVFSNGSRTIYKDAVSVNVNGGVVESNSY